MPATTPSPSTTRPILVTGPPRSGTTWVGMTLALDPSVGYLHEPFSIWTRPGISSAPFTRMFEQVDERNESAYLAPLERSMRFDYALGAQLRAVRSPRDVARTARDLRDFRRMRRRATRPLLKDPIAVFSAEWIERRFGADVVLTIRHPAAVAASFKRLGWAPRFAFLAEQPQLLETTLEPFADEIRRYATAPPSVLEQGAFLWRLIAHAMIGYTERHPDWLLVRQEDVSRDPVGRFEQVFAHVGLPFTPAVRATVEANSSAENPAELRSAHDIRLDSKASLSGWRKALDDAEVEQVRRVVGETAAAFYAADEW